MALSKRRYRDSDFPPDVVQTVGNASYNPTSSAGNIVTAEHYLPGRGPVPQMTELRPTFMNAQQFRRYENAIVASSIGNPLTPGWSGHFTRRGEDGLLTSEQSINVEDDSGAGTQESERDAQGLAVGKTGVVAIRRGAGSQGPDELVENDPFGADGGRPLVTARSGNNDPNRAADQFTSVGASRASPAPLAGLGAFGGGINWSAVITVAAAAAIATYFLARRRG